MPKDVQRAKPLIGRANLSTLQLHSAQIIGSATIAMEHVTHSEQMILAGQPITRNINEHEAASVYSQAAGTEMFVHVESKEFGPAGQHMGSSLDNIRHFALQTATSGCGHPTTATSPISTYILSRLQIALKLPYLSGGTSRYASYGLHPARRLSVRKPR